MRYWWVNHKQTARHELEGGYLWSPFQEASGARSQFYENMRVAAPGELVLSFSDSKIKAIGVVSEFAVPAPKPTAFGVAGARWGDSGWLLPVVWNMLPAPVKPKERLAEFSQYLPKKYSPIHPVSGNGSQKAYLAEIDRKVFDVLIGEGTVALPNAYEGSSILEVLDQTIEEQILSDEGLDSTVRNRVVASRLGQGLFKERIFEYEKRCRLTGVFNSSLLIASHIKPWRLCGTANERLDGANGLLLAPHVDFLFDRGLISFEADGTVMISPRIALGDLELLGLSNACLKNAGAFHERQGAYLEFHREKVFLR